MTTPDINQNLIANPYLRAPSLQMRARSATPTGSRGSATQTTTSTPAGDRAVSPGTAPLVLRLRGAHTVQTSADSGTSEEEDASGSPSGTKRRRKIQWAENVIDNEGLGRKKSKVCCIYHKPRAVGESSSEDSSSSSDDDSDDSDFEGDGARPAKKGLSSNGKGKEHGHEHDHGHDGNDSNCGHAHGARKKRVGRTRRPSPNAYEKMPKYDVKPLDRQPGGAT